MQRLSCLWGRNFKGDAMDKIVLIGGGGHSKVIIDIIKSINTYEIFGIVDKNKACKDVLGIPIVGDDNDLEKIYKSGVEYAFICVAAIENVNLRMKLYHKIKTIGFKLPRLIHSSAIISPYAEIGEGTCVMAGAVINANAKVGSNSIINTGAIVEHDCIIGDNVQISPGVVLAGSVNINDNTFVGIGSRIIQGITIGREVVIGAGAVVIDDIPDNSVAVGIPAKVIKERKS